MDERTPNRRKVTNTLIAVWLVVQIALPLAYYAGVRDSHDERFAWRMFSPIRMVTCNVELYVGGPRQAAEEHVGRDLHAAWRAWLRRGRLKIAQRYMEKKCAELRDEGVEAPWVSIRMICRSPGGGTETRLRREDNACQTPVEPAQQ